MAFFSTREYHDMLLIYGESQGNSRGAVRLYNERYPNRRQPNCRTFVSVSQRLLENGSVIPKKTSGRNRTDRVLAVEDDILDIVAQNPTVSVRSIARQVNVGRTSVHRTLKEQLLHPYHIQRVQDLHQGDFARRLQFCTWFQNKTTRNPLFASEILCTDEASFTRQGVLNFHNCHIWDDHHPHATRRTNFQQKFSINMWAGIIGHTLIGPYELPRQLRGDSYLNFLENVLPGLLEELPLNIRQDMWFLHDGAPPHFARAVKLFLDDHYPRRWIGRNGPFLWPPRSPDLNVMDYYFWGHMKSLVYDNRPEIETENELRNRVFAAADTIRHNLFNYDINENWVRRVNACVRANGNHFEHFL